MTQDAKDAELRLAFARYEKARAAGDPGRLVLARQSLCSLLEAGGWQLPQEVRAQLWRDRRLLQEQEQAADLLIDRRDVVRLPSHRPAGSVGVAVPPHA